MDEVRLKVNSRSSNDDPDRKELLWEKREEVILEEWRQRMVVKTNGTNVGVPRRGALFAAEDGVNHCRQRGRASGGSPWFSN